MESNKPTFKNWLIATRPWSFAVSALPALVAMMYTIHAHPESKVNWLLGVIAIVGAVIFHAGGNLISDYFDFKQGVDKEGKVGGTDTLTSGLFRPRQILTYGCIFIAIGVAIGFFLVSQVGLELIGIGLVGTIGAVFYYQFKSRALGDLLIFLVYGPTIMLGTGYVLLGYIDWTLLFVSFPMAFITVNVLHSNNTRDIRSDRYAEIKTYAMLVGVKASIAHYYVLTALSYVSILVMVVVGVLPATTLVTLITIPIAIKNCKMMAKVTNSDASPINNLDKGTAQLQLMFSALMSLALVVSIII